MKPFHDGHDGGPVRKDPWPVRVLCVISPQSREDWFALLTILAIAAGLYAGFLLQ